MVTTITYAIWTGLSSKGQSMVNVYRVDKGLKPYELDGSKWAKTKHRVNDTTTKSYFKNSQAISDPEIIELNNKEMIY